MHNPDSPNQTLAVLDGIKHALAQATNLNTVRACRDQAEVIRQYLKKAAFSLEMQNKAAEVKRLAERRIGAILSEMSLHGGDRKSSRRVVGIGLEQLGISRMQSARWQLEASLPEGEFCQHVAHIVAEGRELTSVGLIKLARLHNRAAETAADHKNPFNRLAAGLHCLARQQKRFPCIYADPPWRIGKGKPELAYMWKKLAKLPVKMVSAENAHLHLWVPPELMERGLTMLRAWGFRYKTALVRSKLPQHFGTYWQQAHDAPLLGVRGSLTFRDSTLSSWLDGHEHSADGCMHEVCSLIARASPGPCLDLFATTKSTGWTTPGT